MHEVRSFELLLTTFDKTLIDLTFVEDLCLLLSVLLLHVLQDLVILRRGARTDTNGKALIDGAHILIFEIL